MRRKLTPGGLKVYEEVTQLRNKRLLTLLGSVSLILVLGVVSLLGACAQPAPAPAPAPAPTPSPSPAPEPEPLEPVKIGILRGFTGAAAISGPHFTQGVKLVLDRYDWKFAGRDIIIFEEDEGDTPAFGVAHARKMVEGDGVDVVIGPLFSDTTLSVADYLKAKGVPHFPWSSALEPSDHQFYTHGTTRGNAAPAGYFAYDVLGAR